MDFKSMPKIELHAHLSGSISRQCLHDLWLQKKSRGETTLEDPLIKMPAGKFDYDLESFFPLFSKYIYALCNDLQSIIFTTNAVLEDFEKDGVVYLELRTTPRAVPSAGLSSEDYVRAVLDCISSFNGRSSSMKTNLILSIDRRHDLGTAMEIVDLAHRYTVRGVVGIDLCGDPSVGNVSIFKPAFDQARIYGLKSTIHFAESPFVTTEELWTLLSFQPNRLGHVIHVPEDIKAEILKRQLGLELCLSCNVHAKMITGTFSDHHFGYWREKTCPIALSTDDVGVFGSPLSEEYLLISRHFGLGREELFGLARGVIETIFGGELEMERLRNMKWT